MRFDVDVDPKMLRETLCVAQATVQHARIPVVDHILNLQKLINEIDRHRPLGPDGKHGSLHTETCGCEDKTPVTPAKPWADRDLVTGRHYRNGHVLSLGGVEWRCENCGHEFDAAIDADGFACGEDCGPYHSSRAMRVSD